jgi:6,7-dimethyl-8-ribityllumazine synthase
MAKSIEGSYIGAGKRFALIASRFNSTITSRLVDGALDALKRHQVKDDDVEIIWVPGAFEIPAAAKRAAMSKKYSAVICLGAVIRGETPHFDYVAAEVSKGVANVGLNADIPVIYGVITSDTPEQALDRSGIKVGNKGFDAAMAAMEMISVFEVL